MELLELDREFGEYVIVHELIHLKVPNHGPLFSALLAAYLPDWKQRARRGRPGSDSAALGRDAVDDVVQERRKI
jgi:predicted metal-dependent hydrolase